MTKPDGGPAFPSDNFGTPSALGLTKREYAAIHLSVPDSGTDWLDEMIRKSNREPETVMAALNDKNEIHHETITKWFYEDKEVIKKEKAHG